MDLLKIIVFASLLIYSYQDLLPIAVSTIQLPFNSVVSGFTTDPSGNLIVTDAHAVWRVNIEVNPPTKHLIAGQKSFGYAEGTGAAAKFRYPRDVIMMNETHVLVTDTPINCLRAIDLQTNTTSLYAGNCSQSTGNVDGYRLNATFGIPQGMVKLADRIYISDWFHGALRLLKSGWVTTLFSGPPLIKPDFISAWTDEFIYATVEEGIVRINLRDDTVTADLISGSNNEGGYADGNLSSSRYANPIGVAHLDANTLVTGSQGNYRLRIIYLENDTVTSICSGEKQLIDGNRNHCGFKVLWSVHVYKDLILIGDDTRIRTVPLYSLIEDPEKIKTTENINTTEKTQQTAKLEYLSLLSISVVVVIAVAVVYNCKRRRTRSNPLEDRQSNTSVEYMNIEVDGNAGYEEIDVDTIPNSVEELTAPSNANETTGEREDRPYERPTSASFVDGYELPDDPKPGHYQNIFP